MRRRTVTTFEFTPDDTGRYVIRHTVHGFTGTLIVEAPSSISVAEQSKVPVAYTLSPNYPNPFNPVTTLRYELPQRADVLLVIYDVSGREVTRLVDGFQPPGYHQVMWDGRTENGRKIPSGVYIARLVTPEYTKSIKMVLLK